MALEQFEFVVDAFQRAGRDGVVVPRQQVTVRVLEKIYETGRKASEAFKNNMPIDFDNILPRYNYTLSPQMPK